MPPRYAYWTILAGGLPTAFRAAEREELLPTFNRLREKHPDAEMKYFQHGKLWESREEAQNAARERRERGTRPPAGSRAERRARPAGAEGPSEVRGKSWRPGGAHQDPRQPFKDAQKEKNQDRRRERWERKQGSTSGPAAAERPRPPKPLAATGAPTKRPWQPRPPGKPDWNNRAPREKPHGDPLRREAKPDWRDRPREKGEWTAKPPAPGGSPAKRPWQPRPPGKPEWKSRPPREKPHGDPLRSDAKPESRDRPPEKREWTARPPRKDFRNPDKPAGPGGPPGPGDRGRGRPGRPPGPDRRRR